MKLLRKNSDIKIYAFILGIIVGTIVFNIAGVDFSFSDINNIRISNFLSGYIFFTIYFLKYFLIYFMLSFIGEKRKINILIFFVQGILFSGIITIIVKSRQLILLYGLPVIAVKIIMAQLLFAENNRYKNCAVSLAAILVGSILENILLFLF